GVGVYLGTTPMHNAAASGDLEMVRLLVELGADPNVRDPRFDATPLGWAEHNEQREVADYLARLGAHSGPGLEAKSPTGGSRPAATRHPSARRPSPLLPS